MPPEAESLEAKVARLEERQKTQERDTTTVLRRVDAMEESIEETKIMIGQTNSTMLLMPQKIIEAIEAKGQQKKMTARDWINTAVAVLLFLISLPAAAQALQALGKTVTP